MKQMIRKMFIKNLNKMAEDIYNQESDPKDDEYYISLIEDFIDKHP